MGLLGSGRRAINRMLLPLGVEVSIVPRPDTSAYQEDSRPNTPRYINIGAGSFFHPYWHNVDNPNDYYSAAQRDHLHISYDLTSKNPMPFEDATLKVAYTSHVIEHINDQDAAHLFGEVYRCLRPGGYFRIACPDMDLEYQAYMRGDADFWKWPNAYGVYNETIGQRFLDHFATALTMSHPCCDHEKLGDEELRAIFSSQPKEAAFDEVVSRLPKAIQHDHCGDHINWFTVDKLISMLRDAGFTDVYESRFGQSRCVLLRDTSLFDSTCPGLSLYVECVK